MTVSTTFTPDGAGMLRVVRGSTTGTELIAADAALLNDAETLAKLRYALLDFGHATELRATTAEARIVAKQDAELAVINPPLSVAIVAPQDLQFGMSRMWEVFVQGTGWQTGVFRDRPAAVAWLREHVSGFALED